MLLNSKQGKKQVRMLQQFGRFVYLTLFMITTVLYIDCSLTKFNSACKLFFFVNFGFQLIFFPKLTFYFIPQAPTSIPTSSRKDVK